MDRRSPPLSEESYVEKLLSDLVGLVHETQPTQTYQGDWFAAEQLRNSIDRIALTYEEAGRQGFPWAEVLAPSKLFSDWPQLLQFKSNIDGIRSAFIRQCDEKLGYLGSLVANYEAADPALASRFRGAIKNIEAVKDKYAEPLTGPKATVRL
ncbi:hypothetical protein ES703_55792 [subsurface metagenome]